MVHTHVEYLKRPTIDNDILKKREKTLCTTQLWNNSLQPAGRGEGVSSVAIDCHDASAGELVSGFAQSHEENLIKHITMHLDPLQQHILVGISGSLSTFTSLGFHQKPWWEEGYKRPSRSTRSPNHMFQVQRRGPGNTSRHLTRHPDAMHFGREVKTCFDWRSPTYVYTCILWIKNIYIMYTYIIII